MKINLSPCRKDQTLKLERQGDTLIINGEEYDFGPIPDGGTLPRSAVDCDWLTSDVVRVGGQLDLTLILPHGHIPTPAPAEAQAVLFPAALIDPPDGSVQLPTYQEVEDAIED